VQAQTNYTTRKSTTLLVRSGGALASLLVLIAVSVGVLYTLGLFGQPSHRAIDGAVVTPTRPLITYCRVCQDEALAARQARLSELEPSRAIGSIAAPVRSRISNCQICQDEALGANQTTLLTPAYEELFPQTSDPSQRGPR
jgi:hypothetical protein